MKIDLGKSHSWRNRPEATICLRDDGPFRSTGSYYVPDFVNLPLVRSFTLLLMVLTGGNFLLTPSYIRIEYSILNGLNKPLFFIA